MAFLCVSPSHWQEQPRSSRTHHCLPHYITKNYRHFHYCSDRRGELREYVWWTTRPRMGWWSLETNRLSDHICYLLLISYHIIIQKCKLTAAKLSRKLDGPRSWRMRVFGIASWLAPVFTLIYWACMGEPGSPTLSASLRFSLTHTHRCRTQTRCAMSKVTEGRRYRIKKAGSLETRIEQIKKQGKG